MDQINRSSVSYSCDKVDCYYCNWKYGIGKTATSTKSIMDILDLNPNDSNKYRNKKHYKAQSLENQEAV